jgi:hypothetical protein
VDTLAADRPPRLVAHWFGDNPIFERMARVLEFSARKNSPEWSIEVERVNPAPRVSPLGNASHATNTQKMDQWNGVVQAADDDDRILLIDADTMVLLPLDPVWHLEFDLAYTAKDSRFPFNSGVVFLRVNARTRQFAAAWQEENARLLNTPAVHLEWRRRYGGVNQAALGAMLTRGIVEELGLAVAKIPCAEWNCEDSTWTAFDPERTRIVHVKSALRRGVFGIGPATPRLRRLVRIWRLLEREMLTQEGLTA